MKQKVLLLVFTISLLFGISFVTVDSSSLYDEFPNWEFYPQGINYLNNNNFMVTYDEVSLIYSSNTFIKIKPDTLYHLTLYNYYKANFLFVKVTFFSSSKEKIDEVYFSNPDNIHLQFTTPLYTSYIRLYIYLNLLEPLIYLPSIDEFLVLYEGTPLQEPFKYEELRYQGSQVDGDVFYNNECITLIKEFDEILLLSDLLENIKAYDDYDGDITNKIMIEFDNFSSNQHNLGIFEVVLSVRDSHNNRSRLTLVIHNVDTTPPEINGINFYEAEPNEPLSVEYITANLYAIDNYDGDVTKQIVVLEDNYTPNKNRIGTYRIIFGVQDSSHNSVQYTVNVKVSDNEPPIIFGPSTITKKITETLTLEQIKEYFVAIDTYDGDITDRLEVYFDEYSLNMYRYGTYEIMFTVTDSSGNVQFFDTYVHVVDNIAPVFIVDQNKINLHLKNNSFSINEVINLLAKTNKITNPHDVIILEDNYSPNKEKVGTYRVVLQEKEEILEVLINLKDDNERVIPTPQENSKTFWQKVLDRIKQTFKKLLNIFKKK